MLAMAACSVHADVVDGVVATVGTEVILQSELVQEIAPLLHGLRQKASTQAEFDQEAEKHIRAALEQAIDAKILLRQAMLQGLDVEDEAVEKRIEDIKKRFASNEAFLNELEAAGETMGDFRTRVRKQILAISMGLRKRREFEEAVEVSEAAVLQYYQDHKDKFTHPERVFVRRIFLPSATEDPERAAAVARLEELRAQLDAGADFAELAKAYSSGPSADKGGAVGWVVRGDLVKDLEDAVFALAEGGVSDVLEMKSGFVLLKVDTKEAAGTASLDEVRTEIEPELRAKYAGAKFDKWMRELRKRSRVRMFM